MIQDGEREADNTNLIIVRSALYTARELGMPKAQFEHALYGLDGLVVERDAAERGEPVIQTISSWAGWPAEVHDTLRDWNRRFLLTFVRHGEFVCTGCQRRVAPHANGNAVVRPHRKAKGKPLCESCLVALARTSHLWPASTATTEGVASEELKP